MKTIYALLFFLIPFSAIAQDRFANVQIEVIPVGDAIYMLKGAGGNVGISVGNDGVFMIDDQFAPLSEKLQQAIKTVSDKPVRFLVNTHFHGDHSGGNANFEAAGATIIAHNNVRKRLAANERTAGAGLPIITFSEDTTFHMNGNTILVTHVHQAHTDGDSLIYFMDGNVLHTGDTFFNGMFPYIDLKRGGSIDGDIAAAKKGLLLINEDTKIIPGHGPVATKADYQKYYDMLKGMRDNVANAMAQGKTEDEVAAMESLTADYFTDEEASNFFIKGERMRRTVYQSLKNPPKETQ